MSTSILLVSADREMARVLKQSLKETPVKVTMEAATPKEAIDSLASGNFGLVVLDMFLPGSSGLEMLKTLKQVGNAACFVLLTRMHTRALIERAFRLGAQDILHYPVSSDILRDTILHRLETQPLSDDDEDPAKARTAKK